MDDEKALYARAELVELVQNGEMKPEEAEAEAKRLGVGPLRKVADPAQFDPTSKASWTLVMAVAWIVWRTPDAVRKYWDDYRRECSDWEPLPAAGELKAGYALDRQKPASLTLLGRDEAISTASGPDEDRKLMSVKSAREQLWQALEEERLTATGEPDLSGDRFQIPAHKWPSLELTATQNGRRDHLIYKTSGNVAYRNVRLRRSELVKCWPELSDARTELPPLMSPEGDGYGQERIISPVNVERAVAAAMRFTVKSEWPPITQREWGTLFSEYRVSRDRILEQVKELRPKLAPNWPVGNQAKGRRRKIEKTNRDQQLAELREKVKAAQLRK